MPLKTRSTGPIPARIMFVAEAPGAREEQKGIPLVGASGEEFDRILHDAGLARTECFLTNVSKYRPFQNDIRRFFADGFTKSGKGTGTMRVPGPEVVQGLAELQQEIRAVKPNVIVAFGNIALWALQNRLSAKSGIQDWRGSELPLASHLPGQIEPIGHSAVVVPTFHPAAVLREWSWRPLVVHDLRARVKKYLDDSTLRPPAYDFRIRPTCAEVMETINFLYDRAHRLGLRLSVDIETRHGHIACIGLAWSTTEAICIPLMCVERPEGYWALEEEVGLLMLLQELLTHPRVEVIGQNFLYDAQHFAKHFGFVPRVRHDTMFMQHVAYAGMSKGLDFLSSMYASFHQFWKNEGKEWDRNVPEEQLWTYNCKDAVITYEVHEVLLATLEKLKLTPQYHFQMELWHHVLEMMLRGVDIDKATRGILAEELIAAIMQRQQEINFIAGHELNPNSPKQMQAFLYEDLALPKQFAKKKNADGTRSITGDKTALKALSVKEPLLRPLLSRIAEFRSLNNSLGVIQMRLGPDGRARCYFNPTGAESYRWNSSEDAFGSGTNFQNLSRGLEDETPEADELIQYELPNVRRLFKPDSGYTIGEVDQAGADAQVVAWDAGAETLKEIFRKKLKLHVENGRMMYGAHMMGTDGKREPYYTRVKSGGHASHYGAKPDALVKALGITRHEADNFQKRYFAIHPAIPAWHRRIDQQLQVGILDAHGTPIPGTARQIRNKFGYRRYYFDRVEDLLPEALAWIGQSTVAIVSNIALTNTRPYVTEQMIAADIWRQYIDAQIEQIRAELLRLGFQNLLQIHDSFVFQYPARNEHLILPLLHRALTVTIPYDDPLVIPWGLKTSTKSWGDCEEREWPAHTTPALIAVGA